MQLAHDGIHVETLSAARRPQAEKIRVVGQLVLSLFSRDVDSYRNTLTVSIINFYRRFLTMLHPFLVHQAYRSVGEGQKTVIFLVQAVTVARKRTDEQFQLVVCTLTDVYAHAPKSVFQVIRAFLKVGVRRHAHHHVEVRVHEQFAFTGYYVLYLFDVLYGHLVTRIGDACMPVLLFIE